MIYQFDTFKFDDTDLCLTSNGKAVPVEPKVIHLLLYLLRNRNRLVRKQELLDQIWQDSNVTENALTRVIGLLRKALDEDPRAPRFVETVPTLGYKFIAQVTVSEERDSLSQISPIPVAEPIPHAPSPSSMVVEVSPPIQTPARATATETWWTRTSLLIAAAALLASVSLFLLLRLRRPAIPQIRSIAVLPLENLSGDADQAYFANGVTDAISTELSQVASMRVASLRVASRSSANKYRGSTKSATEIAHELNVDAIIEGSVTRQGDRVHISAALVGVPEDRRLWSRSYDRRIGDVLALESDLARDIAAQVASVVTPDEKSRLGRVASVDPEAYDLYLQSKYYLHQINLKDNDRAIEFLEKSVARDSNYAVTQAALAFEYGTRANQLRHGDDEYNRKAFVAVERCFALDPNLADCYLARATLLWTVSRSFDHAAAAADLKHALSLNPNDDEAHEWLANIYNHIGLLDKARDELLKSLALNPGNTAARFRIGVNLNYQGKFQEALSALNGADHFTPSLWAYHTGLAKLELGRWEEADSFLRRAEAADSSDDSSVVLAWEATVAAGLHDNARAEKKIADAIKKGKGLEHFHHSEYGIGAAYALMNRPEDAVSWLTRAANEGFPCYPFFLHDPNLVSLQDNPRFQTLLTDLKAQWERNMQAL